MTTSPIPQALDDLLANGQYNDYYFEKGYAKGYAKGYRKGVEVAIPTTTRLAILQGVRRVCELLISRAPSDEARAFIEAELAEFEQDLCQQGLTPEDFA